MFSTELINRLKFDHPGVDVDRIVSQVRAKMLDERVDHPDGLLASWVKAENRKVLKLKEVKAGAPKGAFYPDGSWNFQATEWNRLTRFIDHLIWLRKHNRLTPKEAVGLIYQHGHLLAFSPETLEDWTLAGDWARASIRRSSEAAVVHAGTGKPIALESAMSLS
jgi:hypothetical protein